MELKPLKVSAVMLDGRIATTDLTLPLDSILSWAWMMINHPDKMEVSQSGIRKEDLIVPELPLERRGKGEDWYWACSFAFGKPKMETKSYWHKRFDAKAAENYVDFGKRRGAVHTGSGYFKGYRMPLIEFLIQKLEWYLVGDKTEVEKLLKIITHLGKKRSQGRGRVAKWIVEPADRDLSVARPVPVESGVDVWAIRPPYWLYLHERTVAWPQNPDLACNWLRRGDPLVS